MYVGRDTDQPNHIPRFHGRTWEAGRWPRVNTSLGTAGFWIQRPRGTFASMRRAFAPSRALRRRRNRTRSLLLAALVVASENHLAGGRLVNRRDADIHGLVDHLARTVDYHHRAVVQIRHALVVLFPFAQNKYAHDL